MAKIASCAQLFFAGAVLVSACTHDFTGYHLADNAGTSGASESGGDAVVSLGSTTSTTGGESNGSEGGAAGESSSQPGSAGASDTNAGAAGAGEQGGTGPTGVVGSSCKGLASTCGPDGNDSCCAASALPGGKYDRSDLSGASATVSAFTLDDYEVTVGRFRNFVAAYSQTMTPAGSGKNPNQALDPGWNAAWNTRLPASATAFETSLKCSNGTFTSVAAAATESRPITCVSWYEAFAFCVWDGGRLPTEAEWNFAAAGGSEERTYPWGTAVPDDTRAVFCPGSCGVVLSAGSTAAAGSGKWGQADLVGNAWEWNVDLYASPFAQATCVDCANTPADSSAARVFRGGSAGNDSSYLLSASRYSRDPSDHNGFVGLRCARNP